MATANVPIDAKSTAAKQTAASVTFTDPRSAAVFGSGRGVLVEAATLPAGVGVALALGAGVPVLPASLPSGVGVGVAIASGAFSKTASALLH